MNAEAYMCTPRGNDYDYVLLGLILFLVVVVDTCKIKVKLQFNWHSSSQLELSMAIYLKGLTQSINLYSLMSASYRLVDKEKLMSSFKTSTSTTIDC